MLCVALVIWILTAGDINLQDMGEASGIKSRHKRDACE